MREQILRRIIREEIQQTDIMRIMKSAFEATKKNKDNIALNYFKKEFRKLESIDSSQWSEYIEDILGDYGYEVDFKTLKVTGTKSELKEQDDPSFIPYVGNIDTWKLKNMYIKNRTADHILTKAEKEFMKKPDVVVITANRFNTIWTDGKQEFQINIKTNKLVKPLRKARKEIQNHFKNLKYRWQGDKLIFEAKWSDFKHTKGFVHIPLGIKTELSNSDRKKITVLTDLELNKNKSFQERFHYFSIYIKGGSLWMSISPAGKRFIRKRMKEDKNYLRELINRIKGIFKKNKYILNPMHESKFNHNAAEAFGAYMRGEISVEEVAKISKQTGKQLATKAELNGFLKNKFMQDLMADTYNTPKNLLVKRVKMLLRVVEGRRRKEDYKVYHPSFTSAATAAKEYAQRKGYEIDEDGWWNSVATGGRYTRSRPSVGKTHKFSVALTKGGKPQRKQLHFQVHGMKSGYELNAYIQ